jgi:uncharacterized membrane protein YcgQ (UPF0703/DUF1980 family)
MKPVFIINGFLESGKTEFMTYTLSQPYFQVQGKTLIILCEEGEVEYDPRLLMMSNSVLEVIDEESDFTTSRLSQLEKKYKPERIIIEYNGMWNFKNLKLPFGWRIEQQLTMIDASTFTTYFTNMKSLLAEMLRHSDMIVFNRCDGIENLSTFKRNVKAINQQAEIIFEDANGEINSTFEEDLPYSLNDDPIVLDDNGFGIWYIDALDNLDRYVGKNVRFIGMVLKPTGFPKNRFVPGRMAMTCCSEDMAFLGFITQYDDTASLAEKEWVEVTARVEREENEAYNGEGPVLYATSIKKIKAPKEKVISFT